MRGLTGGSVPGRGEHLFLELFEGFVEVRGHAEDAPLAQPGSGARRAAWAIADQSRHGPLVLGDDNFLARGQLVDQLLRPRLSFLHGYDFRHGLSPCVPYDTQTKKAWPLRKTPAGHAPQGEAPTACRSPMSPRASADDASMKAAGRSLPLKPSPSYQPRPTLGNAKTPILPARLSSCTSPAAPSPGTPSKSPPCKTAQTAFPARRSPP